MQQNGVILTNGRINDIYFYKYNAGIFLINLKTELLVYTNDPNQLIVLINLGVDIHYII